MRLATFIERNIEPILGEWVTFARQISPAARMMDTVALRDHAQAMLAVMARDLRTGQSDAEQLAKSHGDAPRDAGAPDTAAQVHGAGRALSGFSVSQMVAEYRALRASVIRLWTVEQGSLTGDDLQDLMRFNEAIDQSLAESIERYNEDLQRSKEMFLAILGHDLRSPLGAILTASQFMLEETDLQEPPLTLTTRIERSAKRANAMVEELLDFTRTRLGPGMPLVLAPTDLAKTLRDAVEETQSSSPDHTIELDLQGSLVGRFDAARMSQLFGNLLGNAVHHGRPGSAIRVTARSRDEDVVLRFQNEGPAIAPRDLPGLFGPFKRLGAGNSGGNANSHLGLGLYIAEQIVTAHGGTIDAVSSEEEGTTFTVRLPCETTVTPPPPE